MQYFLDFEKPLVELEQKIRELREFSTDSVDFSSDITKLEKKARITSYNVCYTKLLRDIDPIPYNLLFERFLNPERVSMPDIDVDFCINGREHVINYVRESYNFV